jgi:hypothetical protein
MSAPEVSLMTGGAVGGGVGGALYSNMTGGDVVHGAAEGTMLGLAGDSWG